MSDAEKLARIFKVLSVNTRVRIVQLLKDRVLCVGALAHKLGVTQAAVSQHLRLLRDIDLVKTDKRSNYVHYCLNEETLAEWGQLAGDFLANKK